MKFLVFCGLIGITLAKVDYTGHKVYRAHPNILQNDVINTIGKQLNLDFWSDYHFEGDFVDFRVPPELQARIEVILRHNRIPYEIFIEDLEVALQAQITPRKGQFSLENFQYNVYHTYDEINGWITDFAASSSLASVHTVGENGLSLEGRNMRAIKISTGSDRPAFVINCGIHAREWVTPAVCMYTANRLVEEYSSTEPNPTLIGLMDSVDFYFIPTSNPDGYAYTWTDDRMWRKTRKPASDSNCITNCVGVDPNRNFDAHWSQSEGASDNCCAQDFRGASAFSEIETRNQRDFVNSINNVKGYIDVHAYSQMWMYPYGWTTADSPDEQTLNEVGTASVSAIKSVHNKNYVTGSIADVIYVASGSTADYFYSQNIKCSFAAQLRDKGLHGFTLPEDQIIPTGEETFEGLMAIAAAIRDGKC